MRGLQNVVVVSSLALAGATHAQNAVQWRVEDGGNGHWYEVRPYGTITSWMSSQRDAVSRGGHLATLQNSGEEMHLQSIVGGGSCVDCAHSEFYIGALQPVGSAEPTGGWEWVTGEPMNYSNWRAGEPNNSGGVEHFALVNNCVSGWNDGGNVANCGHAAIIEWSADCNNDGLVDYGQILAGTLADANQNNIPDCCEAGSSCPSSAVQWRVEDGGNGHWYLDETLTSMSFDARQQVCLANGAHLCTITSETEHQFVLSVVFPTGLLSPDATCWPTLGARHFANAPFHWVTGEPFVYAPFLTDQPQYWQEEHLRMWGLGLQAWLSFAGNASTNTCERAVIEYSADCNNDSIIDYGQIRAGDLIDANNNNIPDCCEPGASCDPCPGDVDESGAVNAVDLAAILNTWGSDGGKYPGADIDGNGTVDASDLTAVLSSWGACP